MHHTTPLITTIVGGTVLAFLFGMLANRLRISPLVGYLLAGVIAGPFTPGFVADTNLAPELAELGVILLMFGVGLHFSLKDLMAVKTIAILVQSCKLPSPRCSEWHSLGDGLVAVNRISVWPVSFHRQYRGVTARAGREATY